MAQAQHGSAPDIAGRNMANPMSLLLSVAMLLDDGKKFEASGRLETEISDILATPSGWTADLGGILSYSAFTEQLCKRLAGR